MTGIVRNDGPIARDSLTALVYANLRQGLMEGRYRPGHRFKVRDLAAEMGVSETPIREALMQLVRSRALEMHTGRTIAVAHMTIGQYMELRTIRLFLEGLAAKDATLRIPDEGIEAMAAQHEEILRAQQQKRWSDAVRFNWHFHHSLYEHAGLPEVLAILEDIWMRNGPLLNFLYPNAPPTYDHEHQHLKVLRCLRARDPEGTCSAIQADMVEGGRGLVDLLKKAGDTRFMGT